MEGFVVLEVSVNAWTGDKTSRVVMQSESELLCYRQALALQIEESNEPGSPIWTSYKVISEKDFNV